MRSGLSGAESKAMPMVVVIGCDVDQETNFTCIIACDFQKWQVKREFGFYTYRGISA